MAVLLFNHVEETVLTSEDNAHTPTKAWLYKTGLITYLPKQQRDPYHFDYVTPNSKVMSIVAATFPEVQSKARQSLEEIYGDESLYLRPASPDPLYRETYSPYLDHYADHVKHFDKYARNR